MPVGAVLVVPREASRAAEEGEHGQASLPARRQGEVPAGHRHPARDAGGPRRLESQNG